MSNEPAEMENEFDLMAYADGLLDDDPARKAHVEERLRASPADAARVEAYRAQNAALRRRYGSWVENPVPERLYAALERRPAPSAKGLFRVAAVIALTATAGISGWWVGQSERQEWPPSDLLELARIGLADTETGAVYRTNTAAQRPAPMNWLSDRIALSLRMPDLSDLGYTVIGKETVHVAEDRMIRLKYGRPDGSGFNLLLRPSWESRNPKIEFVRRDDVWLAYWRDGPLASVVASRLPRDEIREIARAIRRTMHDRDRAAPKVQPDLPFSERPGMAIGPRSEMPRDPAGAPSPKKGLLPEIIKTN